MQELRKTWIVGKLYPIRGVGGGGGGFRPEAEKKIVSVGAISTFRYPPCFWVIGPPNDYGPVTFATLEALIKPWNIAIYRKSLQKNKQSLWLGWLECI